MSGIRFSRRLQDGEAIDLWTLSGIREQLLEGEPAPAFAGQGYRFINGFVGIGDLPCRKFVRAHVIGRDVAPETDWPVEVLRLPTASPRIDFTSFWYRPTFLSRWARSELVAESACSIRLKITTCGGVRLWVNGALETVFEPYIRNSASETEITVSLRAGANELLVLAEDMAERDTNWFFEIRVLDGAPLTVALPFSADPHLVETVGMLSASVRAELGLFVDQPLAVVFDRAPDVAVPMRARVISVHHDHSTRLDRTLTLEAGARRVELADPGTVADGIYTLALDFEVNGARVERRTEAAFLRSLTPPPAAPTLAARKAEAALWLARHGQMRMGRALAMYVSGHIDTDILRDILETTLSIIEERHDCSDFEMVPLLWFWRLWGDRLPDDLRSRTRTAILGYRYWVDEPGNDVMWYWSENHVLCFHVAQYLAGRLFPEEIFSVSGRTGRAQADLGRTRLGLWFASIEEEGLAEWNSSAYYPIDFIGLFGLHQGAETDLADRASRLMDRIFAMMALHTMAGVSGGSQGRAYSKELLAGPLTELASVARIAFGYGWQNEGVAASALFAASNYAPPASALAMATPPAGRTIEARYTQGVDHAGRLVVYRGEHVQLSTVVDHQTGKPGHQQHVVDVLMSGHPLARVFVNNPGEEDPSGSHRPSFWAGNGILPRVAQSRDVALLVFRLKGARVPWTHAYLGEGLDEIRMVGQWVAIRSGRGFTGLCAAHGLTLQTEGPTAGHELRSPGTVNGWAVVVGQGGIADFEAFAAGLAATPVRFDAETATVSLVTPSNTALSLGWEAPFATFSPDPVLTWQQGACEGTPHFSPQPPGETS
jgi:hypothetical protein